MLAGAEKRSRDRKALFRLQRLYRLTRGDAAVQRQLDDVIGWKRGAAAAEVDVDDGAFRRAGSRRDLGKAKHFERAGPVRQSTDEAALLPRLHQPVHPPLGFPPKNTEKRR